MRTIKNNSYDIVRLVIDQLGISIFALVLYISMNIIGESNNNLSFLLNIFASVFSILFYFSLIYTLIWEIGAKDRIKLDSGKAEKFTLKGLLLGLFANGVNLVFALLVIFCELVHIFGNTDALNGITSIVIVIIRFTSAMFLRSVNAICSPFGSEFMYLAQGIAYFSFFLLTIGVCQAAYTLGMNNFKIFGSKSKKQ